jgi:hypothetical protein
MTKSFLAKSNPAHLPPNKKGECMNVNNSSEILKDISSKKFLALVLIIPAVILFLDIIARWFFTPLAVQIPASYMLVISCLYFVCLGAWVADYVYLFKKMASILMISFVNLLIFRCIVLFFLAPSLITGAFIFMILSSAPLFIFAAIFSLIYRYSESRLPFAEIQGFAGEINDPLTKKISSQGICGYCKKTTTITVKKTDGLGLSSDKKYFCDQCGIFIRGNPVRNFLLGITEASFAVVFLFAYFARTYEHTNTNASSSVNYFLLFSLIAIWDSIKRIILGMRGISKKPHLNKKMGSV